VTTSTCVAGGTDQAGPTDYGFVLTTTNADSSSTWTQQSVTTDATQVLSVSCADSVDCWAAGTSRSPGNGSGNALILSTGSAGPGSSLTAAPDPIPVAAVYSGTNPVGALGELRGG
jgi:hypothetical protein